MTTYYQVLGLGESATHAEIKKAYRSLAKKFHPDINPATDAKEKFIEVEVAYSCLSKDDSRQAYDRLLKYDRQNISNPNVKRKYQNDVNRRTTSGRRNANFRSNMSYSQYQRDELLRTSFSALVIKSIITILVGFVLGVLFYNLGVKLYGENTEKWTDSNSVYILGGAYILILVGLSYIYEPLVKNLIIGKPKRGLVKK